MLLTTLSLFASALTFNVSYYSYSDSLLYSTNISPSPTLIENNDRNLLSYLTINLSPQRFYPSVDEENVKSIHFDVYYTSTSDSGTSTLKVFSYYLTFQEYDDHDRAYVLTDTDQGYLSGYFGEGNLIINNFSTSVRQSLDNSTLSYTNGIYDYLYYDNIDKAFNFTNVSSTFISPSNILIDSLQFSIVPLNIYNQLYNQDSSYSDGYADGQQYGYNTGYEEGQSVGYGQGYSDAREDYEDQSSTVNSIFSGILSIGLIPLEFFMSIFNFSILGINITSIISAILSLMIIVILLRIVLGGKSGKE